MTTSARLLTKPVRERIRPKLLAPPEATVAGMARWLYDWLTAPDLATLDEVDELFALLPRAVEAIPPTVARSGLMCYLRNRLRSATQLRTAGEYGAAGYELRELALKLERACRT